MYAGDFGDCKQKLSCEYRQLFQKRYACWRFLQSVNKNWVVILKLRSIYCGTGVLNNFFTSNVYTDFSQKIFRSFVYLYFLEKLLNYLVISALLDFLFKNCVAFGTQILRNEL